MKLVTESTESVEYITEEVGGQKQFFIQGVFLQGNKKNRNGRIYPTEVLEREVKRYTEAYITSS